MTVPTLLDEEDRLRVLRRLEVLDTPPEDAFDRITDIASAVFQTPIALVSLVDESRQWFKSKVGLQVDETPRDIAFCAYAIGADDVFVVNDASSDPRFADNPLVTGDPNIRFYAGAPLKARGGANLGTLCVIDREPRDFSDTQRHILARLAELVVRELELRNAANSDVLTGAANRRQFLHQSASEWDRAARFGRPLTVMLVEVDDFKHINDTYGHDAGDAALQAVSTACKNSLRGHDIWARLDSKEFGLVMVEAAADAAASKAARIRKAVSKLEITGQWPPFGVTVSVGAAVAKPGREVFDDAMRRAGDALNRARTGGGDGAEIAEWKPDCPGHGTLRAAAAR